MSEKLKIKVCGMRQPKNIEEIAHLSPDYMGFIFFNDSKRFVGKDFDPGHLNLLHSPTKAVGVFVNEPIDSVIEKVDYYHFDAVQLHGEESPEYCARIRAFEPTIEIIKAFSVDSGFDPKVLKPYESSADIFLFDTKDEAAGGTGKSFDWAILEQVDMCKPFFISGGISNELLAAIRGAASKLPQLVGVDINSKFETAPGIKSLEKIKEFIQGLAA